MIDNSLERNCILFLKACVLEFTAETIQLRGHRQDRPRRAGTKTRRVSSGKLISFARFELIVCKRGSQRDREVGQHCFSIALAILRFVSCRKWIPRLYKLTRNEYGLLQGTRKRWQTATLALLTYSTSDGIFAERSLCNWSRSGAHLLDVNISSAAYMYLRAYSVFFRVDLSVHETERNVKMSLLCNTNGCSRSYIPILVSLFIFEINTVNFPWLF